MRLRPVQGTLPAGMSASAIDGWFREALRQSDWLDIAAGPVAAPDAAPALALSFDAARSSAAVDLVDGRTEHLAAVLLADRPLHRAIDELAVRVRLALGDEIAADTKPVARIYSADPEVVAACEGALADARIGDFTAAAHRLQACRRRDGGSAFLLEAMASTASMQGTAEAARQLAEEALQLTDRRSPTTTHRLLRTLLLTRASTEAQLAGRFDDELWTLAQVAGRERPHDPEVQFTAGVALNFLGRFAESQPLLQRLAARLPDHSGVLYHLGWAALGAGDARTARESFDRVAATLPMRTTAVPRALARFAQGDHEDLRAFLTAVAAEPQVRDGAALHEIRRMQAAHELLCGNTDAAVEFILQDLTWLLTHPSVLELRAGELADAASVLVRLGHGERLQPLLASMTQLWPDTLVADAATYAAGLLEATSTRRRAKVVEDALQRRGRSLWADSLTACGFRQLGELASEQEALFRAAKQSSSPLVKAALIENLRALGRTEQADALRAALHRELAIVDLRRKSQSPLLGPELAMAWLAGGDDETVSR